MALRAGLAAALAAGLVAAIAFAPSLAAGSPGDRLPPEAPLVDYAMVFEFRQSDGAASESGRRGIAISGTRVRDEKLDGGSRRIFIADKATGRVVEFDPADPERRALRGPISDALLPMADGSGRAMQTMGGPRLLGTDSVAQRDCTVLRWQIGDDRQDWCVDADGIVLRAERKAGAHETRLEALTVRVGAQPEALFQVPDGFTIEDVGR